MAIPGSKAMTKSGSAADLARCGMCGGMNGWLPYPGQKPQLWICKCKLEDMQRYAQVPGWIVTGLVGFRCLPLPWCYVHFRLREYPFVWMK